MLNRAYAQVSLMSIEEMIARYGYLALFAGVVVEGETALIAASFAAHQGYLNLPWVMVVAFLGSLGGDEFYFFLGRLKGRSYLRARPAWELRVRKVESLLERHRLPAILGFRFVYGLRSVAPFAIGMSGIKTRSFVLLNAASALAWSVLIGAFGFLIGTVLEALLVDVRRYERLVLLSILISGGIGCGYWYLRKRRLRIRCQEARSDGCGK